MKCFNTTKYTIYKPTIHNDICILLFSDLHFSKSVTNEKLAYIVKEVRRVNPNYIFIVGDLIDYIDTVESYEERNRLINFLKNISEISKIMISLGNHDCYKKEKKKKGKYHWIYYYDEELFKKLNDIENVYILDNDFYEDEFIFVSGITNSFEYYKISKTEAECRNENRNIMISDLKSLDNCLKNNLPKDKLKFILIHSPIYMNDAEVLDILKEYDYILSGHMHNGCVPPILNELWTSTRGIISPTRKILSLNERNTLRKLDDKLVVNGALTTFQRCSGFMEKMNFIFPVFDTILSFHFGNEQLLIEKKYHK